MNRSEQSGVQLYAPEARRGRGQPPIGEQERYSSLACTGKAPLHSTHPQRYPYAVLFSHLVRCYIKRSAGKMLSLGVRTLPVPLKPYEVGAVSMCILRVDENISALQLMNDVKMGTLT